MSSIIVTVVRYIGDSAEFDYPAFLPADFLAFTRGLSNAVPGITADSRYYYYLDGEDLDMRHPVQTTPEFDTFLGNSARFGTKLYAFSGMASPEQMPNRVTDERPWASVQAEALMYADRNLLFRTTDDDAASRASSTPRASSLPFLVRSRDGNVCCACRKEYPPGGMHGDGGATTQVAHIVRHVASLSFIKECGLSSTDSELNALVLCGKCHFLSEAFLWTVRKDTIVVSASLLNHATLGPIWNCLNGLPLRVNPLFRTQRTAAGVWAAHQRIFSLFEAAGEKWPTIFFCELCVKTFSSQSSLDNHKRNNVRHVQ